LYINRYVQVIKYWFKVISSENIIVKSVYGNSILNNVRGDSWPFKVKLLLECYGFSDVWLNTKTTVNSANKLYMSIECELDLEIHECTRQ